MRKCEPDLQLLCLQVRAMQIIDELEVHRRGPYGGGIGHVGFNGSMDMALALRTMIIPNPPSQRARADNGSSAAAAIGSEGRPATPDRKDWVVNLQVGRWRSHPMLDAVIYHGRHLSCVQCMASLSQQSCVQSTGADVKCHYALLAWYSAPNAGLPCLQAGAGIVADSVPELEY